MLRFQAGLPRRGFLALGGSATWCAACASNQPPPPDALPSEERSERRLETYRRLPKRYQYKPKAAYQPARTGAAPQQPVEALPLIEVFYAESGVDRLSNALLAPPQAGNPSAIVGYPTLTLMGDYTADHPEHVQFVARAAEYALWRFRALGFRRPALDPHGGSGSTLRILLTDTRGFRGMTSPDWDYIELSNRLIGISMMMTLGHEIFHRVQYAYNSTAHASRLPTTDDQLHLWTLVFEGGARFAEDLLFDEMNRYSFDAERWFTSRQRPLVRSRGDDGGLSGASYEAALFWKYVSEQHGAALVIEPDLAGTPWWKAPANASETGVMKAWLPAAQHYSEAGTQRVLLEAIQPSGSQATLTFDTLRKAREGMQGIGTLDRMIRLDTPGAREGDGACVLQETTWGNFLCGVALNGQATDDTRFGFLEQPGFRGAAAFRVEVSGGRTIQYGTIPSTSAGGAEANANEAQLTFHRDMFADKRVERIGDDIVRFVLGRPALRDLPPMLRPYSMVAYRIIMPEGASTRLLRIEWAPDGNLSGATAGEANTAAGALVQVIMLGPGGRLVDIHRHDAGAHADHGSLLRTFACRDVTEVLILVCSRESQGNFTLRLSRPEREPVLTATSWNCPPDRTLPYDPAAFDWNWLSPDLDVVSDVSLDGNNVITRRIIRLAVRNAGDRYGISRLARVRFNWRRWADGPTGQWLASPPPSKSVGELLSTEAYERQSRGGRDSAATRYLGRRFILTELPQAHENEKLILKATIIGGTASHRERDVVVLGSSHPVGVDELRSWGWHDGLGPGLATSLEGTRIRSMPVSVRPGSATMRPAMRIRAR